MTHMKSLMKKGFESCGYGSKKEMSKKGQKGKESGRYKAYRVVPYKNKYELYAKK